MARSTRSKRRSRRRLARRAVCGPSVPQVGSFPGRPGRPEWIKVNNTSRIAPRTDHPVRSSTNVHLQFGGMDQIWTLLPVLFGANVFDFTINDNSSCIFATSLFFVMSFLCSVDFPCLFVSFVSFTHASLSLSSPCSLGCSSQEVVQKETETAGLCCESS